MPASTSSASRRRTFDAAVCFYGHTLGLPERARWGDMPAAEFQAGNLTLAVLDLTAFGQEHRANAARIALFGFQFARRYRALARDGLAVVSFTPQAVGRYRASAVFRGTRSAAPSESRPPAGLLVAEPLRP